MKSLDLKCTPWVREGVNKKHPLATEMSASGGGVNPLSAIIFFFFEPLKIQSKLKHKIKTSFIGTL